MDRDVKPENRKCGTCRERAVSPTILPAYRASLDHDGETYDVELRDLPAFRCGHCGELVFGDEAEVRLSQALRDAAGLLGPEEIRLRRESIPLTIGGLAGLLNVSEATLALWEDGSQLQPRPMDMFLRAIFEVPELRRFLGSGSGRPVGSRRSVSAPGLLG